MASDTILLDIADGVATITLNRPDVGNAINVELAAALEEAAQQCAADDDVRCVVLTGAGRMFCVGGDVAGMAAAGDGVPQYLDGLIDSLHRALVTLMEMRKPLLTLVNGAAAGAGLSLAISGDVALAARSSSFLAAYGGVGLTADGGMSWLLPRLVGMREAQRMVVLNRKVDAEEAVRIGLVSEVVDDEGLAEAGDKMAQRLKASAMASIGGARALLQQSLQTGYADQLDAERASMVEASQSAEHAEGVTAFLERRKPDFQNAG